MDWTEPTARRVKKHSFSHHGKDYGLIPIGYQAISWTSPDNLILVTREWSYTAESSIWVVYLDTRVAMLKISSRLQRVNQTSGLPTRLSFVEWTLWHTQSMTKAKTYIYYYYCYLFYFCECIDHMGMDYQMHWSFWIKQLQIANNQLPMDSPRPEIYSFNDAFVHCCDWVW